jgi:[ribosomal protein S5]-alanine N-acetyltransferase
VTPRAARAVVRGTEVFLRYPSARDREEFLERVKASRKLHGRWVSAPADVEAFASWLRRTKAPEMESVLVCREEDGAIAGVYNIGQIFYGHLCSAYLGYYSFAPFAGRGYMREGLQLVLRHAFGPLGLHRLEANIQPENGPSIALVSGAGFRLEGLSPRYLKIAGRWRDHERWAILAEEFRSQRGRRA